ncbi:MAG: BTAD domain-containing putative transcriptional regulator, partial [Planctomycetota bacterium]
MTARKGGALIAYLALSPNQRQTRERLAALLWGDRFEEQARHSLRQTVLALRKALADTATPIVISEGEFLLLDGAAIDVDALAFRDLVRDGSTLALSRAIALYAGDLLEGMTTRAADFDDWLFSERVRYRDMAIDAHTALMGQQSEQGDAEAALATGQRLLAIDPANEDAHRSIMQVYDLSGRRSAALRQFKLYADTLQNEFDAEPDPQMVRLHAEIQARERQRETHHESDLPNDLAAQTRGSVGPSETRVASPEKPSIIVVPFKDPANDNSLKGLASAITEGIATALSMVPVLTVSAPGSTPAFMGQDIQGDVPLRESDNQYVLEGSVQSFSDNVRISARLTDVRSGHLVWGDRYDRVIDDMFALQDEITLNIVASLEVKLTESEHEQITLSPGTRNLQAWLLVGQGVQLLQSLTREDIAKSRECFEQATLLDPDYASGWAGLAWTHFVEAWSRWSAEPLETLERAAKLTEKALELDPARPRTYSLLGIIRLLAGDHRDAIAMGEKALELNPNGAEAAAFLALTHTYSGDLERSISLADHALNLSPYDAPWYDWILGRAYRLARRYEDAIAVLSRRLEQNTGLIWPHIELACSYAELGFSEETKAVANRIMTIDPGYSIAVWTAAPVY